MHYVQIVADGAASDAAMLDRFRNDFGLPTSTIFVDVLYDEALPWSPLHNILDDICNDRPIVVGKDTRQQHAFVDVEQAAQFVVSTLLKPLQPYASIHDLEPPCRFTEFVSRVTDLAHAPRTHMVFVE